MAYVYPVTLIIWVLNARLHNGLHVHCRNVSFSLLTCVDLQGGQLSHRPAGLHIHGNHLPEGLIGTFEQVVSGVSVRRAFIEPLGKIPQVVSPIIINL